MGSLSLPAQGIVYLDTQVIIYSIERHAVYAPLLRPLWLALQAGHLTVATSRLTLMESLVLPMRNQDLKLVADYEALFQAGGLDVIDIDEVVLRQAARLRADHKKLRTPDAIHGASAMTIGARLLVTNDQGFRGIAGLPMALLDDILATP